MLESSIDIHIPGLDSAVEPWRIRTVEVAALGVPPHITVLWPWRKAPVTSQDLTDLARVLKGIKPFQIVLDRLELFPNGTIYLAPQDGAAVRNATKAIAEVFPDCPPYRGGFLDPMPHVTVAKASNEEQKMQFLLELRAVLLPLLPMMFIVKELVVMEQREDMHWEIRTTLTLGR